MAGEGVGDDVFGAGAVVEGEGVVVEVVEPVDLAVGEVGLIEEVGDGHVVAEDGEGGVEVVAPHLEGLADGEEFKVVGGVASLGVGDTRRVIGDDAFVGAGALGEGGAGSGGGGIGVDDERLGKVGR